MSNSYKTFEKFEENGSKALEIMRKSAFNPATEKSLRVWTMTEMCDLINKSPQSIRENEKKGKIPLAKINEKNNKRYYTLEDINKIRDVFGSRPSKGEGNEPAIIAFTNFKGGVAKTTSAIHTAQYFARAGYRVLIIDTDSQASTTSSFGYAPDEDIRDDETLLPFFLGKKDSLKNIIRKTYWDSLYLIPANLALYGIELELPVLKGEYNSSGKNLHIHRILADGIKEIRNDYDIIVIDCPPSMSILNTNALYAANALIIPVPPELPDIASMVQFFGMIKGALERFQNKEYNFIRILITKHDGSATAHTISNALRHIYGTYVMRSEMGITQVIKKARTQMCSVYELESYKGSKQTLARAMQILDDINSELGLLIKERWKLSDIKKESKKKEVA